MEQAVQQVFGDPTVAVTIVLAAFYGVFIGATPGLTATTAMALIVPLTYWMSPTQAIAAMISLTACAIFSGDIPAILLRMPGTPASAAYTEMAYRMTRAGQARLALRISLVFSCLGGLFGAGVLMLAGKPLSQIAVWFSAAEYFWLYVLGLSCAIVFQQGARLASLAALSIGLLLSTVGLSPVHTEARFTFGVAELFQGINFIPAMIGLFGVSEVFRALPRELAWVGGGPQADEVHLPPAPRGTWRQAAASIFAIARRGKVGVLRSGMLGALIGALPGAGADIAAYVAVGLSRKMNRDSGEPETPLEESQRIVSEATTANSASLAGAWIPALVFGIPGDSITAIALGVLYMKNVKPGPTIFTEQASLMFSLYLIVVLANLVLLPVGLIAIRAAGWIVRTPKRMLLPPILLTCVVGAYAGNASYTDVWIMLAMGLLGFLLDRWGTPLGPIVLGLVLGGPLEERFVQVLSGAGGAAGALVDRPLTGGLALLTFVLWGYAVWSGCRDMPAAPSNNDHPK